MTDYLVPQEDPLGDFIKRIERQDVLSPEEKSEWLGRFKAAIGEIRSKRLEVKRALKRVSNWLEAERFWMIDYYRLFEGDNCTSFNDWIVKNDESHWATTLKVMYEFRRVYVPEDSPRWEKIMGIDSPQKIEIIYAIARDNPGADVDYLIDLASGYGLPRAWSIEELRELRSDINEQGGDLGDMTQLVAANLTPVTLYDWDMKKLEQHARQMLKADKVTINLRLKGGGKELVIKIRRDD